MDIFAGWLDFVLHSRYKSEPVFELDEQGLSVEEVPGALDGPDVFALEDAVGVPWTLRCHHILLIKYLDLQIICLWQLKCIILCDDLDFIW